MEWKSDCDDAVAGMNRLFSNVGDIFNGTGA